jgi:putative phosphoribosyl transferase
MNFRQLHNHPFHDRIDAGRQLAQQLLPRYYRHPNTVVLALPRGGVPVAHEIARALDLPLDLCLVRKLGVPGHAELAMGAIASSGVRVLNQELVDNLGIASSVIEQVTAAENTELKRREQVYLEGRSAVDLTNKTVILVDDGVATGATLRAAIAILKKSQVNDIIVAVPVAQSTISDQLRREVNEVVCVATPDRLQSISLWYDEFDQTSDDTVKAILHEHDKQSASL